MSTKHQPTQPLQRVGLKDHDAWLFGLGALVKLTWSSTSLQSCSKTDWHR